MASEWSSIVVGGGAAGLSAALVLGRARRRTLVLDRGGQSNRPAEHVGGLLAQDGVAPAELYERAREQLARYDSVEIRDAEAVDARADGDGFEVTLAGGQSERTRTLVLATGLDYAPPDLPGVREHWGRDVFHCPFCHGWEVRDRKLVLLTDGNLAEHMLPLVRGWTDDVTVVDLDEVERLRSEDGAVRAVVRKDGSEVPCDAVMVPAPMSPRGRLAERLGLDVTEQGLIAVDGHGKTSVPGVYAAGDAAVAPQQVAIAIGSGHMAGVSAVRELLLGR